MTPPTPPTVEPPEVATLREMLKEVEDADYDVDLAGWRREQTAALHYALAVIEGAERLIDRVYCAIPVGSAEMDQHHGALTVCRELAALLRPASEEKP